MTKTFLLLSTIVGISVTAPRFDRERKGLNGPSRRIIKRGIIGPYGGGFGPALAPGLIIPGFDSESLANIEELGEKFKSITDAVKALNKQEVRSKEEELPHDRDPIFNVSILWSVIHLSAIFLSRYFARNQ